MRKGFTLVEIMIVIALIAVLAAISIPNLTRSRLDANEEAAQAILKTVYTASESYRSTQAAPVYPPDAAAMTSAVPPYVDSTVFDVSKQGYVFTYTRTAIDGFIASAHPPTAGTTGNRRFAVSETGILRTDNGGAIPVTTKAVYDTMTMVNE